MLDYAKPQLRNTILIGKLTLASHLHGEDAVELFHLTRLNYVRVCAIRMRYENE